MTALKKAAKINSLRNFIRSQVRDLSPQQLNEIPPGFNNNIIWNLAHLVCAQQNVSYVRAGLPVIVEDRFFKPFMPGTKPEGVISAGDIEIIFAFSVSTMDQFLVDLEHNRFADYSPSVVIPKVYGVEMNTIDDAIDYLFYHEGLHHEKILSLKRALGVTQNIK